MLPKISLLCIPCVVLAASAPLSRADQPFPERYALATDRAAVLKDLVAGTDDYYFYSALYHQTRGEAEKAAALLTEWETKSPDENPRRSLLKNREMLLRYDKDPATTLAWLKEKLGLSFDHQRDTGEARADLPGALDQSLISFAAFEKAAAEQDGEGLSRVTNEGLYRLKRPVEQWKLSEIRSLLQRLTRPDFPGLVAIIARELREKDARFGAWPVHHLLSAAQLEELQKLRPALLQDETFTTAVMQRMRPTEFEDAVRDPAVRRAWLERLWTYAGTLPPKANPLRAHLLYHLLSLDEKQGRLDSKRLLDYLKLPRPVPYVHPEWRKDAKAWSHPATLDYDPSAWTGLPPVGNDEPLVRRLVMRYLESAENSADTLAPLVTDTWLNAVLAETRLLSGAPEPQRWVSLLTPEAYESLRGRTDIEFDPASRQSWDPGDVVTLDVWLKNTPTLLVRVYEINTANVHRSGAGVDTGLDLDGLTANLEKKFDYQEAPIRRTRQTYSFPELNGKRGVWIIEFIGNGKASRALIRKGGLRTVVQQSAAGTAVTVLNEKLQPVPTAFAMVGPKQFTADEKGLILLPLSTQPGPQKIIFDDGTGFTTLETVDLQGENYSLRAGFHVPRESLLPGATASVLIRPQLESNGRPVLLESLENVKVTVNSLTLDGTPASVTVPVEKVVDDQEITVDFSVPDRLQQVGFSLTAEVKSALTGATVPLSWSSQEVRPVTVNGTTATGQVSDLFLSRSGPDWILQCLGLNGEPRPDRAVTLRFRRPEFTEPVEVILKTDASGSMVLGRLESIASLSAESEVTRDFDLLTSRATRPSVIHLRAGGSLLVPWTRERMPDAADVSLLERRGDAVVKVLPLPDKISGGYMVWPALTAGTYSLTVSGAEKTVRVAPGELLGGHVLTPATTIQLSANRPLTISGMEEGVAKLKDGQPGPVYVFHIGNAAPDTRVHVLTSRYFTTSVQTEFDALALLGFSAGAAPSAARPAWLPSQYLSSRNIGDEYRYVLERRSAPRFAGNMLARPGLLINPWEIADTQTGKEALQDGEKVLKQLADLSGADPKAARPEPAASEMAAEGLTANKRAPSPPGDLSFLATAAPALLNLRPNALGDVVIPRSAVGDRPIIRVLAVSGESSAVRDFYLSAAARPPRDLRMTRQLNPGGHYSRQNIVSIVEKEAPFQFEDALAAQYQVMGHLGSVRDLFFNLTQNPVLNEFSWLLEWTGFDDAKKRSLYSRYACHELNFFLHRKDRPFFDAVVKPYLASKRERTFMDDYLLERDCSRYLQPWHYSRLNALERILLAQRIREEVPVLQRQSQDWINNQPVDRERDQFLFETALRGRALQQGMAFGEGRVAAMDVDGREVWVDLNKPERGGDSGIVTNAGAVMHRLIYPNMAAPNASQQNQQGINAGKDLGKATNSIVELEQIKRQALPRGTGKPGVSFSIPGSPEVQSLFNKGLGYYDLGQFAKAEAEFNGILEIDPSNTAARRQLERSQREVSNYLKSARDETRSRMLNMADSLWVTADPNTGKSPNLSGGPSLDDSGSAPLTFKLNNITIDRISFADADLNDVIDHLKKKAAEIDVTEADPNNRGVNFLNRVPGGSGKTVNLDMRNVKLMEAVRTVAEQAGVRFDVQANAVVFLAAGSSGSMTTRTYRVPPDFLTRSYRLRGDASNPDGEGRTRGRTDARKYLQSLGGNFDDSVQAAFDAEGKWLVVKGKPEELARLDAVLPNAQPGSVEYGVERTGETSLRLTVEEFDSPVALGDDFIGEGELQRRYKFRGGRPALFRPADPTKVWAEQQYYRLPAGEQNAALIPMNRFWRDYAVWDGKGGFLTTHVADAAGTFSEMVCALAVLDLPLPGDYKPGKAETKEGILTLTPASRQLLFHQDILPAEADAAGARLLVSQNFYRGDDRYIEEGGERSDKFVSSEFLTGVVYGCQVVVTNPSSSVQTVDVLFQIPAGALPVQDTRRVQSLPVRLEGYRTQTLEFHFYFPAPGKFAHFPVHVSRDAKTAASAAPFEFQVVSRPTAGDPSSWEYVSQNGTANEVLRFLGQHNLNYIDLDLLLWRLRDADFFRRTAALLSSRHVYHEGVWSYAALHNIQPQLTEFLQDSEVAADCGPAFTSPLLTVDPVEQQTYQHLEYSPLINARAHALAGQHRILNDRFAGQWSALMEILAFRRELSAEDWLAVAGYLAAQDRIEEAATAFARVNRAAVAEKLQYEYLRAWLAMSQEDTATARRIAGALAPGGDAGNGAPANAGSRLPDHWRDKFAALSAQLDELEGKAAAGAPEAAVSQDTLAEREPSMDLKVEGRVVKLHYRNVTEVTVSYYPVDLELLFSASPFLTSSAARFSNVRPAASEKIMLPANGEDFNVALPARYHSRAVLVEITGSGVSRTIPVYAHALDANFQPAFGRLTVEHGGKPLPGTYVKVFAEGPRGTVFYKDGYTDLRGKFDYASLSTDDLDGVRRFSILVASEEHGALVQEMQPPSR